MPNVLDATGLTVKTQEELVTEFTEDFKAIYGEDINLDSDSPDSQLMMIFTQSVLDNLDLIVRVNNSFNPENAIGVILDQRVAINGIQRQAGTYTVTDVTIVTDRSVNLYGLDQEDEPVYTVQDNEGNEWNLIATQLGVTVGSHVYSFRAANPGKVTTTPNTITVPVTIVLGVTSINNPTTYTTLGIDEESDAALRLRRQKSVSISAQGYLDALKAALRNINGVTFADVFENNDATPDADGVPAHSIWVIVAGTGDEDEIAQAIYRKRSGGSGMKGDIEVDVVRPDGRIFTAKWDNVVTEEIFVKFTVTSLDGINDPNIAEIKAGLTTLFTPGVAEQIDINELATIVQSIDPNTLVTNAGFNDAATGTFDPTATPSERNYQFVISEEKIIVLPMILTPTVGSVLANGTLQMTALGGYGGVDYTKTAGVGSINLSTGVFSAGAVAGSATLRATDSLGNYAEATITVT